ncbi:MAG TPA: hypothetical protein VHD56_12610 [Tepidisphaeraceae bacterium]|nr:hypothetical protein [Tepidisphaeraceae bacterium]
MAKSQPATAPSTQPGFEIVGHIDSPRIPESSGIVMSRKYPGVYWTQNDSGNPPAVFAIEQSGKLIAEFPIRASNVDWEDIALDEHGRLYLADIGNNFHNRWQIQIYRVAEPDPRAPVHALVPDREWKLSYPDQPFDAESFFVLGDNGYIISKMFNLSAAELYRFSLSSNDPVIELHKVATLSLRIPCTAADVSLDGKWLAIMTLAGPFVYKINGDPLRAAKVDSWHATFFDPQAEGVCFVPGGLLATTEGRRVIFFPFSTDISRK